MEGLGAREQRLPWCADPCPGMASNFPGGGQENKKWNGMASFLRCFQSVVGTSDPKDAFQFRI